MNKINVFLRACLCLALLVACSPGPAPVQPSAVPTSVPTTTSQPAPTFEPPPKVELDESFYSSPRRLGNATKAHELLQPPEASLISLNLIEDEYLVEVNAEPGAVPSNARVVVANLESRAFALVNADDQGGFSTAIHGYPGAHILVKQDSTGRITSFDSMENMSFAGFILAPGVIMQIPIGSLEDGAVPVSTGFATCCEQHNASWIFEGNISSDHVQVGEYVNVEGQVTLLSSGPDTPDRGIFAIHAIYIGDETGRQVGFADLFVSVLTTPTGLAIERNLGAHQVGITMEAPLAWQKEGETWTATVKGQVEILAYLEPGRYTLFAGVYDFNDLVWQPQFPVLSGRCCDGTWLTVIEVADPAPTRLTATLLADLLSEGSRGGVIAREDTGLFEFSTRAVTHHSPVVPRLDAFGVPWSYQLGPFLPLVGGIDRNHPPRPLIDFDFTTGDLRIEILRPDGTTDTLGPAPITRLGTYTPITPWFDTVSLDGGNLGEVPQLIGDGDTFAYRFPMNGDYAITLEGQISDLAGREYEISGTYDVTVADIFDIETASLPGTPFEVGDSLPIGLYVLPGLPADLDYKVTTTYADGKVDMVEYHGQANAFGWWDGDGQSHLFEKPGEYRVDVEARFDGGENLWIGRMTFGGVIASPNPTITMHGRRGPDNQAYLVPVWGFDTDYEFNDISGRHFNLPYFSGDILWGTPHTEFEVLTLGASDAVIVHSSIQILDRTNRLAQRAVALVEKHHGYNDPISLQDLIRGNQIPLITIAEPFWNPGHHADQIDFWSYLYHAIERPGVRVREIIKGTDLQTEYWRFDEAYHLQSGNGIEGDLPGDFKFMYGGAVLRDDKTGEGEYAIYGSGWVHTEYDDPLGGRVMPPFQGAAGGPSGGPLFTIFDQPIDMFFVPLAVRPGMVLELGDTFRMAGPIMPTLPSKVNYTVTGPDGTRRSFNGIANAVGYFYLPADDFILDQTGEWTVELTVTHDGMTSAGPVEEPYPMGGPLTPDLHSFSFFVVESAADRLPVYTNLAELDIQPWHFDVDSAAFVMPLPEGIDTEKVRMVATIPGIVLASEELEVENGQVAWRLDGPALNRLVHNLDYLQGLADTITVTFFAENGGHTAAGSLVVHGWHVPLPPAPSQTPVTFPAPEGKTIQVTSITDSGPGTLRQALLEAERYDVITFDPSVFPPDAPVTISLTSGLPELSQGNLTIDASNAGVILDGSSITAPEFVHGLTIISDHNTIQGLQIVNFSDAGIALNGGAQHNLIGGDPVVGDRRWGQGNLISGNGFGVGLWDEGTSHNTIQGNMIGVTWNGGEAWGNARDGIHSVGASQSLITGNVISGNETGLYLSWIADGNNTVTDNLIGVGLGGRPLGNGQGIIIDHTSHNVIGPGNTIAHNRGDGLSFWEEALSNTVTQNSLHDNGGRGILITRPDQIRIQPPRILDVNIQAGTVSGTACANCTVEIFSDSSDEGAIYEGSIVADENGAFTFEKGAPLAGPSVTAISMDSDETTSEFSPPVHEVR